ncbi:MAG: DUF1704 domain-containing protein [Polyangiaceae bacterium]|nr:DUF1704 domain-containing protein [Polyangiaceae bacterium]
MSERGRQVLHAVSTSTQLLAAITWPSDVERTFFATGALPSPRYEVNRDQAQANLTLLDEMAPELSGDAPLTVLLRRTAESFRLSNAMLLAVGTKEFHTLSREAYGGARTTAHGTGETNLDFAEHLVARLGDGNVVQRSGKWTAEEFCRDIESRMQRRAKRPELNIELSDELSAKASAGTTKLRVRRDATFDPEEARGLFCHEVETHLLTAQNGAAQSKLPFLKNGGPRTTRTQEGLAVFSEFHAQAMTSERLLRLVNRVRLVAMAEDGADFLDLYRFLRERGHEERAAYLDASRICRGGLVTGGAPFTKDAVYLAGFLDVYEYLRTHVSRAGENVPALLVCGRIALEDMPELQALADDGTLEPPAFLPAWARRWDDLLTHFAVTSFLSDHARPGPPPGP